MFVCEFLRKCLVSGLCLKMSSALTLVSLLLVVAALGAAQGHKILVMPLGDGSRYTHTRIMKIISDWLAADGHQVTLTSGQPKVSRGNFTLLTYQSKPNPLSVEEDFMLRAILQGQGQKYMMSTVTKMALTNCRVLLSNKKLLSRLRKADFDLIIVDADDLCSPMVVQYLRKPSVSVACSGLGTVQHHAPSLIAYVPNFMLPYTDNMFFLQRCHNFMTYFFFQFLVQCIIAPQYEQIGKEVGIVTEPQVLATMSNASLILANLDFSYDFPQPVMPNTVLVGGIIAQQSTQDELSGRIARFADGRHCENGIIVVSMGSAFKYMDEVTKERFFSAVSPYYCFIWRYTSPVDFPVPKNVRLVKSLQQNVLMRHNRTRLLIMHGEKNSIWEALHCGIPLLIIPLHKDQFVNAQHAVNRGIALSLEFKTFTARQLYDAIETLLTNETYIQKVYEMSHRYNMRPFPIRETVVYWVNHVIEHQGAAYLNSAVPTLNFVQYHMLDVLFCAGGALTATVIFLFFSLKWMCRRLRYSISRIT